MYEFNNMELITLCNVEIFSFPTSHEKIQEMGKLPEFELFFNTVS